MRPPMASATCLLGSVSGQLLPKSVWGLSLSRFFAAPPAGKKGGAAAAAVPDESTSGHRDKMRDLKHAGRHGSKLKATDPEAFERMRSILDYQGLPLHREASVGGSASVVPPPAQPADHVYINNLQTLRFLNFDPAYKAELARYKVASLNRELQPSLAKAQALLDHARKQRLEPQRNAAPVPFVVRSSTPPADKAQSDRKADK